MNGTRLGKRIATVALAWVIAAPLTGCTHWDSAVVQTFATNLLRNAAAALLL